MAGRAAMQFREVQPHEGPSQEALTVAFTPGSMPGHVGAIEVDVQGNITGFYLIMRVAGREAMVNCSVQMAWWAPYGQNRNAHPEERRRRGRRTRRRQNRNHQEPRGLAAAAAAQAVQQPGSSRDAPPDGLDWELEEGRSPRDMWHT